MNSNDIIGFVGVAILLIAFLLNITNRISRDDITYILMNFIGAGIATFASVLINYWPFIILEGIWAVVSLIALIKHFKKATG